MSAAVAAYKHEQLVRVMAVIVRAALKHSLVSPNDVAEDIVEPQDRQGVVSNAWNALVALDIVERADLRFTNPDLDIYGGRTQRTSHGAKGRWVGVYFLKSRERALTWARANGVRIEDARDGGARQTDLTLN